MGSNTLTDKQPKDDTPQEPKLYAQSLDAIQQIYGYELTPGDSVVLRRIARQVDADFQAMRQSSTKGGMSQIDPLSEVCSRFFYEHYGIDVHQARERQQQRMLNLTEIGMLAQRYRKKREML